MFLFSNNSSFSFFYNIFSYKSLISSGICVGLITFGGFTGCNLPLCTLSISGGDPDALRLEMLVCLIGNLKNISGGTSSKGNFSEGNLSLGMFCLYAFSLHLQPHPVGQTSFSSNHFDIWLKWPPWRQDVQNHDNPLTERWQIEHFKTIRAHLGHA